MKERKAFKNNHGRGFHLTFPNGVMLSTQFGWGNYCENYDSKFPVGVEMEKTDWESNDAEIAIIAPDGKWITSEWSKNDDTVQGRVDMERWLSAFDFCRNWKTR